MHKCRLVNLFTSSDYAYVEEIAPQLLTSEVAGSMVNIKVRILDDCFLLMTKHVTNCSLAGRVRSYKPNKQEAFYALRCLINSPGTLASSK